MKCAKLYGCHKIVDSSLAEKHFDFYTSKDVNINTFVWFHFTIGYVCEFVRSIIAQFKKSKSWLTSSVHYFDSIFMNVSIFSIVQIPELLPSTEPKWNMSTIGDDYKIVKLSMKNLSIH